MSDGKKPTDADRLDGPTEDLAENAEKHGEPDGAEVVTEYIEEEESYSRTPDAKHED